MSKLTEWAKKNPGIAALLRRVLVYILLGGNPQERAELLAHANELDTDGDGVPDYDDEAPNNPANKTRKSSRRKEA